MKLHPEGLEQVHVVANPGVAPWGCGLASRRDLLSSVIVVMLCSTNSARLLQKQAIKNLVQPDLKQGKRRGKKPTPKPQKTSKSRVCVPSDCIFMPTRLLCINVSGAPGGIVSRCSDVLCNRKGLGYSETLLNYATDTVPHAPSCARIFPSAAS